MTPFPEPLDLPPGHWVGWYQLPAPYPANLHRMQVELIVHGESFHGSGSDDVGQFLVIEGTCAQSLCRFVKCYARHRVFYQGLWSGTTLNGHWDIPRVWSGAFSLWPVRGGQRASALEPFTKPGEPA